MTRKALQSALSLGRFGGFFKAAARIGETHYWHTGEGGDVEAWVRLSEGWKRVPQAKAPDKQDEARKYFGHVDKFRDTFLDFVSDKKSMFSEDELKEYEQAKKTQAELYEIVSAPGSDKRPEAADFFRASLTVRRFDRKRRERTLALLQAHESPNIETKPLDKQILSRRSWMADPEAATKRAELAPERLQKLQKFISKDVYESLKTRPVSIDVGEASLYDQKGKRGTRRDPIDYGGPVIILSYKDVATVKDTDDDLYHEYMHHLWHQNEDVRKKVSSFFQRRTAGEAAQVEKSELVGEYKYKKDKWEELGGRAYTGRIYGASAGDSEEGMGMEVLSCGMERFMYDPEKFARQDPEFFDLVLGCLRGW